MPRDVIVCRYRPAAAASARIVEVEPGPAAEPQVLVSKAFRPSYRLRKTDEYSSVFAFRKALRGRFFMLHFRAGGGQGARLGIVVAKKLARLAVQRNLIRRIARDVFRHMRASLPSYDLILRLSASPQGVRRAALREDAIALFGRLRG